MGIIQPDDLFALNRNDVTYKVKKEDLMAKIETTDYMLINRNDTTYKINGQDVLNSFYPQLTISQVNLSNMQPSVGAQITATGVAQDGLAPYTITYEWLKREADDSGEEVLAGYTTATITVVEAMVTQKLACKMTVNDSIGNTASETSAYTNPVLLEPTPPKINQFILAEDDTTGARFTNQDFNIVGRMIDQGVPESVKTVDVYTKGSVFTNIQFSEPLSSVTFEPNIVWNAGNYSGDISNVLDGNAGTSMQLASAYGGTYNPFSLFFVEPIYVTGFYFVIEFTGAYSTIDNACHVSGDLGNSGEIFGQGGRFTARISNTGNYISRINIGIYGTSPDAYLLKRFYTTTGAGDVTPIIVPQKNLTALNFQSPAPISLLSKGTYLNQASANGTVSRGYTNGYKVLLETSNGNWQQGVDVVGPTGDVTVPNVKKYIKFDQDGTVTDLLDEPMDPKWTSQETGEDAGVNLRLKFPNQFDNGMAPDTTLVAGTELHADMFAISDIRLDEATDSVTPGAASLFVKSIPPELSENLPIDINGYYPLYTTEEASNGAGDGTSHAHTINNVTYYMPNGVTFYHGNYTSY